jgi:phosphohistidine phosphatase
MKNLFLLRHAKSSWKNHDLTDFDRPLNNRGINSAPQIAAQLKRRKIEINLVVSSSAKRASDTAQIFADILECRDKIVFTEKLYLASGFNILKIIRELEEDYKNILIVSHNPGITDLANYLGDNFIENIPTSGVAGFSFKGYWRDIEEKSCGFLFFDFPKKL